MKITKSMHWMGAAVFGLSGVASAGGVADAWVTIADVEVEPGASAMVGVSIEVDDLIGSFDFHMVAGGMLLDDVIYNGPLFSLGWDGWDTAPSMAPSISAACIFEEDQVTGLQELFTLEVVVPADAPIGSKIDVTMNSANVTNYQFQQFDVHVIDGEITVIDPCPADFALDDGMIDTADLLFLFDHWGTKSRTADLTGDGMVTVLDLLALLESWGACP
jgi:hypothetical protein